MNVCARLALSGLGVLVSCAPDPVDDADVYPRNCGVEGPVALFEAAEPQSLWTVPAGEGYLVSHWPHVRTRELWTVDRCGDGRLLHVGGEPGPTMGVAGEHLLECDESTGAVAFVDPLGIESPRELFESVHGCRVIPVGHGLAAQETASGTVWFHPDPSNPDVRAIVVTEEARVTDPSWFSCWPMRFDCEIAFSIVGIRAVGDDLLVPLEGDGVSGRGRLIAFSTLTLDTRTLDEGPVRSLSVLSDGRSLVVDRHLGPTMIVDSETGASFEFCCANDLAPIRRLGDWLVVGNAGSPTIPASAEWLTFRAIHLPTGRRMSLTGSEVWDPLARLSRDTILVDIRPEDATERTRHVMWPATGERREVRFPGLTWVFPGKDGVYALHADGVSHLPGPNEAPRVLLDDALVRFVTTNERIVFQRTHHPDDELTQLWVSLADETQILIDQDVTDVLTSSTSSDWPLDVDEVVYIVETNGRQVLRRTALP